MVKLPGSPVRGSSTGRPVMVLFDILGQRWTLRILWELRNDRSTFRELRSRCEDVSPSLLNRRLKSLRELGLVDHTEDGYGYTRLGTELGVQLAQLNRWSNRWAKALEKGAGEVDTLA